MSIEKSVLERLSQLPLKQASNLWWAQRSNDWNVLEPAAS